jgi:aquaporin TIP
MAKVRNRQQIWEGRMESFRVAAWSLAGLRLLLAEGLGTFLFLFVGIGAVLSLTANADPSASLIVVALAHGIVLAVLVSALGAVSGGHFNPAVTFGVWIAGHIPGPRASG